MTVSTVIGCAVWDRVWCLDVWFDSLLENVDPSDTGLAFVVYAEDQRTREIIARRSGDFAAVDITRHRSQQFGKEALAKEQYASLAQSRNSLLKTAHKLRPEWYLNWDPNIVIPAGSLDRMKDLGKSATTIWSWTNRQAPRRMMYESFKLGVIEVEFQDQMFATALGRTAEGRVTHLSGGSWEEFTNATWKAQVIQQFVLLNEQAYRTCSFGPHPDGEFVKLSMDLARRGLECWCYADEIGVSIQNQEEVDAGLRKLLLLAGQTPLASQRVEQDDEELQTLGLYPTGDRQ